MPKTYRNIPSEICQQDKYDGLDSCDQLCNLPNHRFSALLTLKFDRWSWQTKGNLFHAPRSYVCHFMAIRESKLPLSTGNAQFGSKLSNLRPVWPFEIWRTILENNRAPFLCPFKFRASFPSHLWIQTRFRVRIKFGPCDLEIWRMTLENNMAPLLYPFELFRIIPYPSGDLTHS